MEPRDVVHAYLDALAAADLDRLAALVTPDLRALRPDGTAACADRESWLRSVAEDPSSTRGSTSRTRFVEDDRVVIRYRLECVERATGRPVTTSGTKIYTVRDGRVARIAGHDDVLGVLRQLGKSDL